MLRKNLKLAKMKKPISTLTIILVCIVVNAVSYFVMTLLADPKTYKAVYYFILGGSLFFSYVQIQEYNTRQDPVDGRPRLKVVIFFESLLLLFTWLHIIMAIMVPLVLLILDTFFK